jgi:hypothetical protein
MYGLSLGVQRMNEVLPSPVYALLSGLNSSTVGIIALAAVQLAEKAIKDKLTRILVIMGAVAGLCYNALWYFPTLMAIGGLAAVIWDGWLSQKIRKTQAQISANRITSETARESRIDESSALEEGVVLEDGVETASGALQRRTKASGMRATSDMSNNQIPSSADDGIQRPSSEANHAIRVRVGIILLVFFFGKCRTRS